MSFPFITRGHHEDALNVRDEEIARLKIELQEAHVERKRLMDMITFKSTGLQVFGTLQIPKEEEEPEPRQYSPEKDSAEPMVRKPETSPAARARDVVKRAERENLASAAKDEQENERMAKLLDEARLQVANDLKAAKERGYKAAEVPANGNH